MTSGSGSANIELANSPTILQFQPAVISASNIYLTGLVVQTPDLGQISSGGVLSIGSDLAISLNNVPSRTVEQGGTFQLLSASNDLPFVDGSVEVNSVSAAFEPMFAIGQSPFSNSSSVDFSASRTVSPESDLGLLAWLENSPQALAPGEEWGNWDTESGAWTSNDGDAADSVDAAFAALEDSALVGATI
jgi:hypothetical protein